METIFSAKVKNKIKEDIKKVEDLITAQLKIEKYRECPLYQDVIDTQMFGISKELELAVSVGLVTEVYAKKTLDSVERKLNAMYIALEKRKVN